MSGRDAGGRFLPGNAGGPGRPRAEREVAPDQETLRPLSGSDLCALALLLASRDEALAVIEAGFPPWILARVREVLAWHDAQCLATSARRNGENRENGR